MDNNNTSLAAREDYAYKFLNTVQQEIFDPAGIAAPPYRINHGQAPGQRPGKRKVLGSCFNRAASTDGVNEIFACPTETDTYRMLETYLHEYCHAIDDCKSGHGAGFIALAKLAGFTAPWRATPASDELREWLQWYIDENGPIPCGALKVEARLKPKQSTRMIKAECYVCGFIARTSRKHVDRWQSHGSDCPCCKHVDAITFS